ncbi:MAG: hypothetical protein LBK94_13345 [Prevotellaceae bacterium]|nr:hypothetical protein [Prevotellaceae bacterium]
MPLSLDAIPYAADHRKTVKVGVEFSQAGKGVKRWLIECPDNGKKHDLCGEKKQNMTRNSDNRPAGGTAATVKKYIPHFYGAYIRVVGNAGQRWHILEEGGCGHCERTQQNKTERATK